MSNVLAELQLRRPDTVTAALEYFAAAESARYLAGGTDLIVNLRKGLEEPDTLIDLTGIEELGGLTWSDPGLRIGAGVKIADLTTNDQISERYPAIAQAARMIAGPTHRESATVGGNLCLDTRCIYYNQSQWWRQANDFCLKRDGDTCHVAPTGNKCRAAFSGDLAPALMVHGANIEIAGPDGRRRLRLDELYIDDGADHLDLAAGEMVVAVWLPQARGRSAYDKVRTRAAIDFPLAGVAVAAHLTGGSLDAIRVAVTGANSRPILIEGTDEFLGKPVDEAALSKLNKLVQKQVSPMRTTLATGNYRRLAAAELAERLTAGLVGG